MAGDMSSSWYSKVFGKSSTKDIAKERLKLVLFHDRSDLSPQLLEQLKNEIIIVLSKYIEIDKNSTDVEITRIRDEIEQETMSALIANIPIISVKDSSLR